MSDLSLDARALIDAARGADEASPADRERVRVALTATLAAGAGGAALGVSTGAAASASLATTTSTAAATTAVTGVGLTSSAKLVTALVLAGTIGGTVALAPRLREAIDATPAVETPSSVAPSREASRVDEGSASLEETTTPIEEGGVQEDEPLVEAQAPVELIREVMASRPTLRPSKLASAVADDDEPDAERLLEELGLLRRASEAARSGDPGAALTLLSRHRDLYPNGELSAERQAATVLALCDSGRSEEARATAERFLSRYRTSPLRERVRSACALTPGEELSSAD